MNAYPASIATTGTQKNFTLADLQAGIELAKSLPPIPKCITFNNLGLSKFLEAAKIDNPPICYGFLNLTFEGVNCFLVPGQIEEYKINY
ncbi:hypothetical protein [Nitrosomonas sp.]|uniref:hypothetical protein n=1 Tax=Nitrosomonas sp. TaxID=42353 RepID=UPI0025FF09CA|nr:hypothetical protein [Nitrosomonas sp.]